MRKIVEISELRQGGSMRLKKRELTAFDIKTIKLMTYMYNNDAVDDEGMDILREMELEYYSLLYKNEILEEKMNIDTKTGLLKYRDDYLPMIMKSASRMSEGIQKGEYHIALIRFDIDDFAFLNNRYGHDKGDEVLVDIAQLLKSNSRPTDYVIRFGGEEMDVILPGTDEEGALIYLKKIYDAMEKTEYEFDGEAISVTMSAGVAACSRPFSVLKTTDIHDMKQIYWEIQKKADNALYEAKVNGKNQYCVYQEGVDYTRVREIYSRRKLVRVS
jgi:diguanylate cyclase (GGDEF)-like protein